MNKIYLDNSATTITDEAAVKAMLPYFSDIYGNPSSFHSFGRQAKKALEDARIKTARLINAKADEIIFTACGTESDNIAIFGTVNAFGKKCHLIATKIEHHAVLYSFKELEKRGFAVTYLSVDKNGVISLDELKKSIREDTLLVSIMHANNEVGSLQPIEKAAKIISVLNKERRDKIYFHTDAVQTSGKISVNVQTLGVDLLAMSAHKFNGPKGVGALYIRSGVNISPIIFGGHHENNMRPGTENIAYAVGLAKALELSVDSMAQNSQKIKIIKEKLQDGIIKRIPDITINGNSETSISNVLNISFNYIEGESLLAKLDMAGIAVSTGSACASGSSEPSHVLSAMGIDPIAAQGAIRFSFGHHNTEEEIDYVLDVLPKIVEDLRKMSPLYKR
ncbi:MAG: cysteine desulfurase [Elusimicrobiota bacterium]|jgi:cysteine desulfurase|nr:cysteine desulfurase [Elusimicrobiota bacterium]